MLDPKKNDAWHRKMLEKERRGEATERAMLIAFLVAMGLFGAASAIAIVLKFMG